MGRRMGTEMTEIRSSTKAANRRRVRGVAGRNIVARRRGSDGERAVWWSSSR